MTPEQFETLFERLREANDKQTEVSINRYVNGKVDKMNSKIDQYIKDDTDWKVSVSPSIEIMRSMQGFASTGTGILKTIIMIGSAGTAIWAFIKFVMRR